MQGGRQEQGSVRPGPFCPRTAVEIPTECHCSCQWGGPTPAFTVTGVPVYLYPGQIAVAVKFCL